MSEKKKSNIDRELSRFKKQIDEIYGALESVDLMQIPDMEERLKAASTKASLLKQLPLLMAQLDELMTKDKLKQNDIKGSTILSPLDDGTLD